MYYSGNGETLFVPSLRWVELLQDSTKLCCRSFADSSTPNLGKAKSSPLYWCGSMREEIHRIMISGNLSQFEPRVQKKVFNQPRSMYLLFISVAGSEIYNRHHVLSLQVQLLLLLHAPLTGPRVPMARLLVPHLAATSLDRHTTCQHNTPVLAPEHHIENRHRDDHRDKGSSLLRNHARSAETNEKKSRYRQRRERTKN